MSTWKPNATVACVIEQNGRYLMVEERDKRSGRMVFNQPAGHLDQGETLQQAALRETREETGWEITLTGVLSIALYPSPDNGITYHRTTFSAEVSRELPGATLDPDIHAVHWLSFEEILALSDRLRSPLVLRSVERHRQGPAYSLDIIETQ